ncbi:hypothetical protein PGQ11_008844 [Apiospora arundinis]|uniref:DUF6604 domain-containing protein n=1 Tax=Apiospora arundinis TaxID=335852 RepID=A0ABR2IGI9_9PEZI
MAARTSPPTEILTTYRQYKRDTESVAGWLAENAVQCGFMLAGAVTDSGPRLKGKARKQARAAKAQATYTVKVSEFIEMADTIAKAKPRPYIPQALGCLFRRAIGARRECTHWYQHQGKGDDLKNKKHQHFTDVLQVAWQTLRPLQAAQTKRTGSAKSNAKERNDDNAPLTSENIFSALSIQYTVDSDFDETDEPIESAFFELPGITPAAIEKEEEDIEADFFFAIYSFLCDVKKLRSFVQHSWSEYASGKMELGVASLLTNTAIHLVRREEQALDLCIQRPKKYPASQFPVWTFPALFMYTHHRRSSKTRAVGIQDFIFPSSWTADLNCETATLCMWLVYNAVKCAVAELADPVKTGPRRKTFFAGGTWLLAPYECNESKNATFERIRKLLPDFYATAVRFPGTFANDEITRGIGKIFRSRTLPVWAVFGIQVLLDTQDILQDSPTKQPLQELQSHLRGMMETTELYERENNPFGVDAKNHGCTEFWVREGLIDMRDLVLGDAFRNDVRLMLVYERDPKQEIANLECTKEDYYYLKRHPLRCGLLKYCMYLSSHCPGVCYEKHWQGLVSLVHIYAACRRLHPDEPAWPDMELFLHNQDMNYIFVGGIPKSTPEALRKISLAFGCRDSERAMKGPLKLRLVSDPNPLEGILREWIRGGEKAENSGDWLLDFMAAMYDPKSLRERAQRAGLSASEAESQIAQWSHVGADPAQVLHVLSFYLTTDTDLYFEWHQMHAYAEKILSDMNTVIHNKTGNRYRFAPIVAYEALVQAKSAEETRTKAYILDTAWNSIKKLVTEEGLGDKIIAGIVERAGEQPRYPCKYVAKQLDKLYKNWSQELRRKSSAYNKLAKMMADESANVEA